MPDLDPALEEGQDNPDERPEWLPENFKTPEDLAASYKESQRKISELSQQNKAIEDSFSTLSQQFEEFTTQQNQPDPNQVYTEWQERFDNDPISTVQQIAAATAQQVHEQYAKAAQQQSGQVSPDVVAFIADQTLTGKYGEDWNAYKTQVGDLVRTDPLFQNDAIWKTPQVATEALDRAYEMVRARDVLSGNNVAQQAAADTRAMKLAAQSAVGGSGRPEAPPVDEWAQIKAAKPKNYWE